jgi:hypothetical protein
MRAISGLGNISSSQLSVTQRRYCYPVIECKLGSNGRPDRSTP